jgi:Protein of unknown function (DUF2735)
MKETTMSETQNQGSATIHQFPEWPRARAEAQRKERERTEAQPVAVSSGWYHAAAIDESKAS